MSDAVITVLDYIPKQFQVSLPVRPSKYLRRALSQITDVFPALSIEW
jgi:hypothetical protein